MIDIIHPVKSTAFFLFFIPLLISGCTLFSNPESDEYLISPNVILIIGDGMGPEQVKAAGYFQNGASGSLSFEGFPYQTEMTTYSKNFFVTDSAAAATAMATGHKVFNKVISMAVPGNRRDLETILEKASGEGKKTGLVTTSYITHATPAAFAAHTDNRHNLKEIAEDYLTLSRPDVLFGGGSESLSPADAEKAGYAIAENLLELQSFTAEETGRYLGSFGNGHMPYMYDGVGDLPELSDMAMKALELLELDEDGFFLMIEAGRIDHAGHANDLVRNIHEVLELSDTVEKVLAWAEGRDDTTIIVTADHETGGMTVLKNNGAGVLPDITWRISGHTGIKAPVYIWGSHGRLLSESVKDNTDIYHELMVE